MRICREDRAMDAMCERAADYGEALWALVERAEKAVPPCNEPLAGEHMELFDRAHEHIERAREQLVALDRALDFYGWSFR